MSPTVVAARRAVFPFTAIVGQEEMKLSLLLNVIDPKVGGVMIMGDRLYLCLISFKTVISPMSLGLGFGYLIYEGTPSPGLCC